MEKIELTQVREMQAAHKVWVERNFPGGKPHHGLLGMSEEVGELSHAHLKTEQGIRGYDNPEKSRHDKMDSLGDIFIYAMSYCNTNGLDLAECIEMAWSEVVERDWQTNPAAGTVVPA